MSTVSHLDKLQAVEASLAGLFSQQVRPAVFIDVGAHEGSTLRPYLAAGWRVVAFEPVEANRRRLLAQFDAVPLLTLRPEAVSDNSGWANFHLAVHPDGTPHEYYHSLEKLPQDEYHRLGDTVAVPTVRLDDLAQRGELPWHVGVLKVDTEGHDLAVLRGAAGLQAEVVCVEFWCPGHALGASPSPPEEMIRLMAERGYDLYLVIGHRGYETFHRASNWRDVPADAWGNLFFFRSTCAGLYHAAVRHCRDLSAEAPPGSLFDVLSRALAGRTRPLLLDVGAYQGDFTADFQKHFPDSHGLMFEPTPQSYASLAERFGDVPSIRLFRQAVGPEAGTATLRVADQPYNNSLLAPVLEKTQAITVPVTTIDQVRSTLPADQRIDCLKIDTQGYDLEVLRGATKALCQDAPVVLVEVCYAPLYEHQADWVELGSFMKQHGYRLAGIFHAHTNEEGFLAFAGLLFVPAAVHARLGGASERYTFREAHHLAQQNRILQAACDERLALIHQLQATCDERLALIHQLQATCDERLALIHQLQATCDERLALIHQQADAARPAALAASRGPVHPLEAALAQAGWLRIVFQAVVSAALLGVLVWLARQGDLLTSLRQLSPWALAAAVALQVAAIVLNSFRWRVLLQRVGKDEKLSELTAIYFVGLFLSLFLPTSAGGDAYRVYAVGRRGDGVRVFLATFQERLLGLGATLLVGLGATFYFWNLLPVELAVAVTLLQLGGFVAVVLCLHPGTLAFSARVLGALCRACPPLARLAEKPAVLKACDKLRPLQESAPFSVRQLATLTALSLPVILIGAGMHHVLAGSLEIDAGFMVFCLVVPLVWVVRLLPVSLNGIGTGEGAFVVLMGLFAVPKDKALALTLAILGIQTALALVGGLVLVVRMAWGRRSVATPERPRTTALPDHQNVRKAA